MAVFGPACCLRPYFDHFAYSYILLLTVLGPALLTTVLRPSCSQPHSSHDRIGSSVLLTTILRPLRYNHILLMTVLGPACCLQPFPLTTHSTHDFIKSSVAYNHTLIVSLTTTFCSLPYSVQHVALQPYFDRFFHNHIAVLGPACCLPPYSERLSHNYSTHGRIRSSVLLTTILRTLRLQPHSTHDRIRSSVLLSHTLSVLLTTTFGAAFCLQTYSSILLTITFVPASCLQYHIQS